MTGFLERPWSGTPVSIQSATDLPIEVNRQVVVGDEVVLKLTAAPKLQDELIVTVAEVLADGWLRVVVLVANLLAGGAGSEGLQKGQELEIHEKNVFRWRNCPGNDAGPPSSPPASNAGQQN